MHKRCQSLKCRAVLKNPRTVLLFIRKPCDTGHFSFKAKFSSYFTVKVVTKKQAF